MSNIFYVVGTGRCGTGWVANILNTSSDAIVFHEMHSLKDHKSVPPMSPGVSVQYIEGRKSFIAQYLDQFKYFGEANGYMTYHIDALREVFDPGLYLLVRDGRDVVRSWYSRATFREGDARQYLFSPEGETRFEKLCWWWDERNRAMVDEDLPVVIFEKLLSDWEYFSSFFGWLDISKVIWDERRFVPKNITEKYRLPKYDQWTPEQKDIFEKRCGTLMRELGYEV